MLITTSIHDPFWDSEDSADDDVHAFEMQAAIVKIAQTTALTTSKSFRSSCSYSKYHSEDEQTDHENIGGIDLRNSWAQTRDSPTGSKPGSVSYSTTRQSRLGYEPARPAPKSKIYNLKGLVHRANVNRYSYHMQRQQVASSIVDSWQSEPAEASKKGATMALPKQVGRSHASVAVLH